jgi:hypothetical protein
MWHQGIGGCQVGLVFPGGWVQRICLVVGYLLESIVKKQCKLVDFLSV